MEAFTASTGWNPVFTNSVQQSSDLWRPWTGSDGKTAPHTTQFVLGFMSNVKYFKTPHVIHPVKLYWPKSRCFDYLYQDAEMLLRCYPVQATICPYEDSSSDEDGEDEEEDVEKEQN